MNGRIYIVTNLVNGKQYIGQTRRPLTLRWKDHVSNKKTSGILCKAIKKYGKQNFTITLICEEITSQEELDALEIKYIHEYQTLAPNGYNISTGGYGGIHGVYKIHPDQYQEIVDKYLAGSSGDMIAKEYNVVPSLIRTILTKMNIQMRSASECQQILLDKQIDSIHALYLEHNSTTKVAFVLGISESAVRRFLIKHGIKLTGRGKHQLGKKRKK